MGIKIMTCWELVEYCLTLPGAVEDYPFVHGDAHSDDGAWTVMRHRANRKGFAHVYKRNGKPCVNLKCDPLEADFLRQMYRDISPAYHMNKTHWITVTLGGDVPEDELNRMIERSYDLTRPRMKPPRKEADNAL